MNETQKACEVCEKNGVKLKVCSKCKSVRYCSEECQLLDWEHHRDICKPSNFCKVCEGNGALRCSKCRLIRYCSKECQYLDWHHHEKVCEILAKDPQSFLNYIETLFTSSDSLDFDKKEMRQAINYYAELKKITRKEAENYLESLGQD